MYNICREIIKPTKKLKEYIYCLILILIIYLFLFILDFFYINADKSYYYIFLNILLLEAILTKYYPFAKIFCFTIFISTSNYIIKLGLFLQNNYSIKENKFIFFYYLDCIFINCSSFLIVFNAYKEMKAIFIEEYENSRSESESGTELKNIEKNNNE